MSVTIIESTIEIARPPEAVVLAARYVLQRDIERELPALAGRQDVTDRLGELVAEARSLGIDPALEVTDALGRPFPLSLGRPISGLYRG